MWVSSFEGINRTLWNAMSLKTDKSAIYIEKQSFDCWIAHNSTYFYRFMCAKLQENWQMGKIPPRFLGVITIKSYLCNR